MAIALMAANPAAPLTAPERARLTHRLQVCTLEGQCVPFTARELAELRGPLCEYIGVYHPRITAIVERQFHENAEDFIDVARR